MTLARNGRSAFYQIWQPGLFCYGLFDYSLHLSFPTGLLMGWLGINKGRRLAVRRTLGAIFMILLLPTVTVAQEKVRFPVGASSHVLGFAPLWAAANRDFWNAKGWTLKPS